MTDDLFAGVEASENEFSKLKDLAQELKPQAKAKDAPFEDNFARKEASAEDFADTVAPDDDTNAPTEDNDDADRPTLQLDRAHRLPLGHLMVYLLKGPVYRSYNLVLFMNIQLQQSALDGRFREMGLNLVLDEDEGYAFLRTREESDYDNPKIAPPRLLQKRQLPVFTSFILTWLRLKVHEFDTLAQERYILTFDELFAGIAPYFGAKQDEPSLRRKLSGQVNNLADMGFIRKFDAKGTRFEILRIIKAVFSAAMMDDMAQKLQARLEEYSNYEAQSHAEGEQQ